MWKSSLGYEIIGVKLIISNIEKNFNINKSVLDGLKLINYNEKVKLQQVRRNREMKMTFQPKNKQRKREHGFRKRMASASGRRILMLRRRKGRRVLSA